MAAEIEAIWECSARTCGAPRVHAWLRRQGSRTSCKRVARIMRTHGWVGVSGRRRPRTTIVDRQAKAVGDLVARNVNPAAPDVSWAGDIERHEALPDREEVRGLFRRPVAAGRLKLRAA